MGTRRLAMLVACILWCSARPAHADPKAEVTAKARAAMASYDSMDYEAARKLLNQALAIAKRAKLDKDPIVARVYLDLGIAQLAGSDQEAAKVAFLSAAQIDPKITIDAAYKSAELVKMLEEAKAAAGESGEAPEPAECKAVRGLQHTTVDSARANTAQPVEALVGGDLTPAKVVVMFRAEGAIDFTEAKLTRQAGCHFVGSIPAAATRGTLVHYYLVAYDANNKVLAAKGSSGSPNIVLLAKSDDAEDPINGSAGGSAPPAVARGGAVAAVSRPARRTGKTPSIMLALAGGTGFGYVSGKTEGDNVVQTCCIGTSLVVITPELAYYASPRLSLGLAVRLGIPVGANIDGHSKLAPSAFLRLRYALSKSGNGLRLMAELGGGVLRNTLKLTDNMAGMDTDIVAQGPLLLGAGIGYTRHLSPSVALFVDLAAMAGIAIVDKVGSAVHLNTGVSADLALGFAVGF